MQSDIQDIETAMLLARLLMWSVQNAVRYSGHRNVTLTGGVHSCPFKMQSDIQDIETALATPLLSKVARFQVQSDIQDIETWEMRCRSLWKVPSAVRYSGHRNFPRSEETGRAMKVPSAVRYSGQKSLNSFSRRWSNVGLNPNTSEQISLLWLHSFSWLSA